ncbi:serine hydrolase domain-containing protein [Runella sp.]|uniref:serine hydrolase domain-containing protein n=1 Tax=Runella sp. TaxID=1960881 RepID=UPI003D10EE15
MNNLSIIFRRLAALLSLAIVTAKAQNNPEKASFARLDSVITKLMTDAKVPGLSLALIRNAQFDYSKSYGVTKADSTQRVDLNTVFEAASLTKPVFAYAVLQLVEEGKIDLDKPLYEYLPYPDVASDKRYEKITARLVLSHRSGFPNWRKDRKSNHLSMRSTPGERFGYSGEGFVYLQKVVEKITGNSINDVMEERVLKPLKMSNSGFVWKPSFNVDYAYPHDESGKVEEKYMPSQANMAYSLHTTANDYARFVLALLNATGLKRSTLDQMFSAQTQLPSRFFGSDLAPNSYWGLGIGLEKNPTGTYLWHWGDNGAFKCFVMVNLAQTEGVIYFSNGSNGLDFADELVRQTIGGQHSAFDFLGINWQKELNKKAK